MRAVDKVTLAAARARPWLAHGWRRRPRLSPRRALAGLAGDRRARRHRLTAQVRRHRDRRRRRHPGRAPERLLVYLNYNGPGQQPLGRITAAQAQAYLDAGQFPPGSMGPKIEAALQFPDILVGEDERALAKRAQQRADLGERAPPLTYLAGPMSAAYMRASFLRHGRERRASTLMPPPLAVPSYPTPRRPQVLEKFGTFGARSDHRDFVLVFTALLRRTLAFLLSLGYRTFTPKVLTAPSMAPALDLGSGSDKRIGS
jgi:hypothetical protein